MSGNVGSVWTEPGPAEGAYGDLEKRSSSSVAQSCIMGWVNGMASIQQVGGLQKWLCYGSTAGQFSELRPQHN